MENKDKKPNKSRENRHRLAHALRDFMALMNAGDAPDELFMEAARTVEGLNKKFAKIPIQHRVVGCGKDRKGDSVARFDYGMPDFSPMSGPANPISPPITMYRDNDDVVGHVNFSPSYEGPPGFVHGGFIAAAFDELFGFALSFRDKPEMTGVLTVRFRRPCPLQTELRMECKVLKTSGRRVKTKASMYAGDQLIADAEALFVAVDVETYKGFAKDRNRRKSVKFEKRRV